MKRVLPSIIVLLIAGLAAWKLWPAAPATNPDPNHTHADFVVWIEGTQLDFSDERYMSGASTDAEHEDAHHPYFHLHDGNGHVIHRHKPGLMLKEFFTSIGQTMEAQCLTIDEEQFASLNQDWVRDFARTKRLCNDGKFRWQMYVNGQERPFDPNYVFGDLDQILLFYGAAGATMPVMERMTDDACLYSKTCPERGDPPAENCVSDPTVPCIE